MNFIGDGLKCEQCTSYEHTKCGDPFHHEDGTVKTTEFLEECPAPEQGKPAYDMCRKIYQNGKFTLSVFFLKIWLDGV